MHEAVIYADLTFLINFILDALILGATSRIVLKRILYFRVLIAALMGGIYATLYLSPGFSQSIIFSFGGKIIFSLLMVVIALQPKNKEEFYKGVVSFYILCFVAVGASIAVNNLQNSYYENASLKNFSLLIAIITIIGLVYYTDKFVKKRLLPKLIYDVEIVLGTSICAGRGFMDTGNGLRDPLTNKAVIVAEYNYLQNFFPDAINKVIRSAADEQELINGLVLTDWANRLRLIPFSSIGKKKGLLIGFRADRVNIKAEEDSFLHKDLVIAVYCDHLSSGGEYQFIIPASIL